MGRNFKAGAKATVGSLSATRVTLNKYGQLIATAPIGSLRVGRYCLRVINQNGLDAIRPNKVYIIPA